MKIYCCACTHHVEARLTNGGEIYPHRPDLRNLPFWICDLCSNFVGCHHKTANSTAPLGCIPTEEIRNIRKSIHALIDPLYKFGGISRRKLYEKMSKAVGWEYHTAKIRTIEEAHTAYEAAKRISEEVLQLENGS